jgi:hypothetical protein
MERAHQKLTTLRVLWDEKRGPKTMPSRADLSVTSLRPWLGNLALIDLTGAEPYFRLCGTSLHRRFGGEMTRRKLNLLGEDQGANTLRQTIEMVRKTHMPAQVTHEGSSASGKLTYHELYVPLAHDGVHVDTVLFASYAEQHR